MIRHLKSYAVLLALGLTIFTGCHPQQPFYFHEDGDLSHYLNEVTQIEYADVETEPLADASQSQAPLTISDAEFKEMWDLSLEEVIHITLQNSKVIRNLGGVTPFGFADGLVGRTASSTTIYDPSIAETTRSGLSRGATPSQIGAVTAGQVGGVESALSYFDAEWSVIGASGTDQGAILSRVDRPRNIPPQGQGANFFANVDASTNGGIQTNLRKYGASGGTYTLSGRTNYNRLERPQTDFEALPSFWTQTIEARWDQPLLRGRGTMVNRIPVTLARINEDISLASFEASVRNLLLDVENTYWDLHCAYRNLETAKVGRDSAQVTWKIVYEKWQEGVESIQAEAQSREQYFFFRSAVESTLTELFNAENRLRFLMGLAATDGRLVRPIDEPTIAHVDFEWTSIHAEALVRNAELRQQKWSVKQRELEIISAKNQLLPQLDVGAVYKWVGLGDDLIYSDNNGVRFPNVGSTAFEELTRGDYQEFGIFFNFNLPVGFRRELAGVRNAQLQLARSKAVLEDMELNQSHLLTTAVRNLDQNYVLAQTHFNRWSAAEKEVEAAQALYKGGKTTLDMVLDAQRRRANAQIDYYQSLCSYNKSIAEVHFRKGSLLEFNNIDLAEGPWPEKAYWDALGRARKRDASYYLDYGYTRPNVVSRGPVPQHTGEMMQPQGQPVLQGESFETIETPEPTPVDGSPETEDMGDAFMPGTLPVGSQTNARPLDRSVTPAKQSDSGLELNAPTVRTVSNDQPVSKPVFSWNGIEGKAIGTGVAEKDGKTMQAGFFQQLDD